MAELHALLAPLRPLLGVWRGTGEGSYPTISSFAYREEEAWEALPGKPVLAYSHKTSRADTGAPMHREAGFIRASADGSFTYTLAQANGVAEAGSGRLENGVLELQSTTVVAATVTEVKRSYSVSTSGDSLRVTVSMETFNTPLTQHLQATLTHATQ